MLTPSERQIVSFIQLNAELSIPEIARALKMRSHTIQYGITQLLNKKVMEWVPFIDVHKLGLNYYMILFSLAAHGREDRLIKEALSNNYVTWCATIAGQYQYGITILAASPAEAHTRFQRVLDKAKVITTEKSVAVRILLIDIARSYLGKVHPNSQYIRINPDLKYQQIDSVDDNILKVVSSIKIGTFKEAAHRCNLPLSTFNYRMKVLREKGIYVRGIYRVNSGLLGSQTFKVVITTKSISEKITAVLENYALSSPYVIHFVRTFGEWDYEMNIEVPPHIKIFSITQEIYRLLGDAIHSLRTMQILEVFKFSRYYLGDIL